MVTRTTVGKEGDETRGQTELMSGQGSKRASCRLDPTHGSGLRRVSGASSYSVISWEGCASTGSPSPGWVPHLSSASRIKTFDLDLRMFRVSLGRCLVGIGTMPDLSHF